jgi:hypothetical protein
MPLAPGITFTHTLKSFTVRFDDSLVPALDETQYEEKVRYVGPYIYLDAKVDFTYTDATPFDACEVGFIQQCDAIDLSHAYASGNFTRWEFSQTPLSDAPTGGPLPWYSTAAPNQHGAKSGSQTGKGMESAISSTTAKTVSLSMNDNLASNVQWWDVVVRQDYQAGNPRCKPTLKQIVRKQQFTTWLVARFADQSDPAHLLVLRKVVWVMHFRIKFNCAMAAGMRGVAEDLGTKVLENRDGVANDVVPAVNFSGPNCNADQKLYRYGATGTRRDWIPW